MKNNLRILWHTISSRTGVYMAIVTVGLGALFYFSFGMLAGIMTLAASYIIAVIMMLSFAKSDDEIKRGN